MFLRFVVGTEREHHRSLTGIITEARDLRDRGALEPHEVEWLEATFKWLNLNLPCPPFSRARWPTSAVCWFKDSAGEPLRRMWEIANLLEEHGQPARVLRSAHPGKRLYEDDYQVVVVPWNNL